MASLLLDTTVHIHWSRGVAAVVDWLKGAVDEAERISTSSISVAEIYTRAHVSELETWSLYFTAMEVLPPDHNIAVVGGRLRYNLARQGFQIHLPDALIAATALETRSVLVTANAKDFRRTGVQMLELQP